jgi:hypothetical protein
MDNWGSLGKGFIGAGAVLALIGIYLTLGFPMPPLGRLPGDIRIEKENFHFYFPLTTCLLASAVLSFILWLFSKLK